MNDTKLILLTRIYDNFQAHAFRALLESKDIDCVLMDEHHMRNGWHISLAIGGVRVMVPANQYDAAKHVLHEFHPPNPEVVRERVLPESLSGKFKFLLSAIVTLFTGTLFILKGKNHK